MSTPPPSQSERVKANSQRSQEWSAAHTTFQEQSRGGRAVSKLPERSHIPEYVSQRDQTRKRARSLSRVDVETLIIQVKKSSYIYWHKHRMY